MHTLCNKKMHAAHTCIVPRTVISLIWLPARAHTRTFVLIRSIIYKIAVEKKMISFMNNFLFEWRNTRLIWWDAHETIAYDRIYGAHKQSSHICTTYIFVAHWNGWTAKKNAWYTLHIYIKIYAERYSCKYVRKSVREGWREGKRKKERKNREMKCVARI